VTDVARTLSRPSIAYALEGTAGPPILLVMGFGMRGAMWRPQVEGLRRAHRVASYDHLGTGDSDPAVALDGDRWTTARAIARAVTISSMARDALRVMDALAWPDAHVVGVSMGGMIAQEIALRYATRVRSLTLVATHAGGVVSTVPPREGLQCFVEANTSKKPSARVAALKRLLYPDDYLSRIDVARLDRQLGDFAGRGAPMTTIAGHFGAVLRHRTRARLPRIHAPTLVVRPGRDILIDPHHSDVIARAIPHAKLLRLDDAGHGVTFQCAAEINRAIAEHVAAYEAALSASRRS
jgi:pimeloyl-ACP methyl ester carboxylesterase